MKNIKILIADEDQTIPALRSYLVSKGFDVVWVQNGQIAMEAFTSQLFDFCIFDFSLPLKDGVTLTKEIRNKNKYIPILLLASKTQEKDRINAFKVGCDDLVLKPYNMEELLLRIKAILKRIHLSSSRRPKQVTVHTIGNVKFNTVRQTLSVDSKTMYKLTTKETALLSLLCEYKNRMLERSEALVRIWGDDGYFNARSMDVYITKLRRFLKIDPNVHLINVHGIGFKLVSNNSETDDETEE